MRVSGARALSKSIKRKEEDSFMKILVIVAHPSMEQSRANRALIQELNQHENIDVHSLYGEYSDWNIDVERESNS